MPSYVLPGIVAVGLLLSIPGRAIGTAQTPVSDIAELWQAPANIATEDLLNGPGGAANAPDPNDTYRFVRDKKRKSGSSPGLVVTDSRGRRWHVKQGREGGPEVVVSHLLSAVGYHQPAVYFLRSFKLAHGSHVETMPGGRFRLTDPSLKSGSEWAWEESPFVGAKPYQGLLVMLVLFNSADLKNSNNSIYELKPPRGGVTRWYVVRDLGASFGATGRFDPAVNKLNTFERHPFIVGVKNGYVEFDYQAVHNSLVRQRITPDDVRWASALLGKLSDRQWHDAFRGAGYEPAIAEGFIRRLTEKIAEGARLESDQRSPLVRDFQRQLR